MKIYLAGPDVFRPDAGAYGAHLKRLCERHGLTGLFPLDAAAGQGLAGRAAAQAIYQANIALLDSADLVMANLDPFRGHEPDSGTAFEIGYAHARGKPVWAYTRHGEPQADRLRAGATGGPPIDAAGFHIEDFGLPLNLMIACSATVVIGDAEACLRRIADDLAARVAAAEPAPPKAPPR